VCKRALSSCFTLVNFSVVLSVISLVLCLYFLAVIPASLLKQTSVTSMNSLSDTISLSQHSSSSPYVPDFTVRAMSDLQYIRIRRAHYVAALRATLLERRHRQQGPNDGANPGSAVGTAVGLSSLPSDDDEDAFTKEWRRAQSALAASPLDGAKSDTGSIPDDFSVRDVAALSQPSFDNSEPAGMMRTDAAAGELSSPVEPHRPHAALSNAKGTGESIEMPLLHASSKK
jgi:hypothetical protein